jgi:AraC-like DNA-binding protein
MHRLSEASDLGLEIHRVPKDDEDFERHMLALGVHRDDHYVLLLHQQGTYRYRVDFEEWVVEGRGFCFISPGEIHEILSAVHVRGWYLAVDVHLIPEPYQRVFQEVDKGDRWLPLEEGEMKELEQNLEMILARRAHAASKTLLHLLVSAFTGLVAECYQRRRVGEGRTVSRQEQIYRHFRALVEQRFREEKRPAAYAAALHLSLSHLNDSVRAVTGLPVGHWIQHTVMLEARRQLYYGDKTIQEIGFELGYEDPAYFSRVFRQVVGQSPAQFRQQMRVS